MIRVCWKHHVLINLTNIFNNNIIKLVKYVLYSLIDCKYKGKSFFNKKKCGGWSILRWSREDVFTCRFQLRSFKISIHLFDVRGLCGLSLSHNKSTKQNNAFPSLITNHLPPSSPSSSSSSTPLSLSESAKNACNREPRLIPGPNKHTQEPSNVHGSNPRPRTRTPTP